MSRNIASYVSSVRNRAGVSRSKLAGLLGVSERTIKNWEDGVSQPDAELFLEMLDACNEHLANVIRHFEFMDIFDDAEADAEQIRQTLITCIRSTTTDDMNRKLLYNLCANHGSDATAQIELCTAYNHLAMEDKYDICKLIVERYRLRSEQNRLIRTKYGVSPDLDYLEAELARVRKEITKK